MVCGLKLQGLFLKRQKEVSVQFAEITAKEILTSHAMWEVGCTYYLCLCLVCLLIAVCLFRVVRFACFAFFFCERFFSRFTFVSYFFCVVPCLFHVCRVFCVLSTVWMCFRFRVRPPVPKNKLFLTPFFCTPSARQEEGGWMVARAYASLAALRGFLAFDMFPCFVHNIPVCLSCVLFLEVF